MNENIDLKRKFVYFEKQYNDRLCGLYCLNSLFQGPIFDAGQLSIIAQNLDEMERKLYEEDNQSNLNQPTKILGNVDDDGNYNIQVLSEALKIYNAEIVPLKKSEAEKLLTESIDNLEAFIFNSSTHWFAIRKIENIWFNLNSTNPGPGPQIISDFYLSAFIKGTEELGYTNFLIKYVPELPDLDSQIYKNLQSYQKLVSIEEIIKHKPKKINMGDTDDQALEKALELSKQLYEHSQGKELHIPTNSKSSLIIDIIYNSENDLIYEDDLRQVMDASLNEYVNGLQKTLPEEPQSEGLIVNILAENLNLERKFNKTDKIGDIKNYVKCRIRTLSDVRLYALVNNKIFINDGKTLEEEGFSSNETLIAQVMN